MPDNRFYIDHPLEVDLRLKIEGKEAHHIMVMRKKAGEKIELINGHNLLAEAKILSMDKKGVEVVVEKVVVGEAKKREFILCQALSDFPRLELILQKATELGVHEIWLFSGERSLKQEMNAHQMQRMEALLISAIKQCGRLDLPSLHFKESLEKCTPLDGSSFFGAFEQEAPLFLSILKEERRIFFFIGPPSGFSDREKKKLVTLGARGVRLNDQVLRSETAALCAVALGMH